MKAELLDPVPVVLAHGLSRRFGPQRRHVGVLVGHEGRKHGGGGGMGRLRGVWEMREGTSHVCVAFARLDLWQMRQVQRFQAYLYLVQKRCEK